VIELLYVPKWSKHAERRKDEHNITEKEIADTWIYGIPIKTNKEKFERWRIIGNEITLIVTEKTYIIITMFPNSHSDKFYEHCANWNKLSGNIQGIVLAMDESYNSNVYQDYYKNEEEEEFEYENEYVV